MNVSNAYGAYGLTISPKMFDFQTVVLQAARKNQIMASNPKRSFLETVLQRELWKSLQFHLQSIMSNPQTHAISHHHEASVRGYQYEQCGQQQPWMAERAERQLVEEEGAEEEETRKLAESAAAMVLGDEGDEDYDRSACLPCAPSFSSTPSNGDVPLLPIQVLSASTLEEEEEEDCFVLELVDDEDQDTEGFAAITTHPSCTPTSFSTSCPVSIFSEGNTTTFTQGVELFPRTSNHSTPATTTTTSTTFLSSATTSSHSVFFPLSTIKDIDSAHFERALTDNTSIPSDKQSPSCNEEHASCAVCPSISPSSQDHGPLLNAPLSAVTLLPHCVRASDLLLNYCRARDPRIV